MSTSKRSKRILLAGAVALAGLFTAGGIAVAGSDQAPLTPPLPAVGPPMNYGGALTKQGEGLAWDAAISQVLSGQGMDPLRSIVVAPAPSWTKSDVPWLTIDETGRAVDGHNEVLLTWLGSIAQGAVAELHHTSESAINEVVGGSTINVELPDQTVTLEGGRGYVATGQTFAAQDWSNEQIVQNVSQVLTRYGLQPDQVDVLRPDGPAILVRVSIGDNVEPKWTVDELRDAIAGTPKEYEGVYLEIDDRSGSPLLASGASYRTGLGGLWFAPGQDQRFGALHGHLPNSDENR